MSAVLDYIFTQEGNQKEVLLYFYDLLTNELKLSSKIRYKIPFYDHKSWICYLNPLRGGKVEFAFIRGQELSNSHGLLQSKNRKQIAGIELGKLSEIPFEALHEIISEAIRLDENEPYKFSRK